MSNNQYENEERYFTPIYEHSDISDLAKESKIHYSSLDIDSDLVIGTWGKCWINNILNNKENTPEIIINHSHNINNLIKEQKQKKAIFHENAKKDRKKSKNTFEDGLKNGKLKRTMSDETLNLYIDYQNIASDVDKAICSLIVDIVRHEYTFSPDIYNEIKEATYPLLGWYDDYLIAVGTNPSKNIPSYVYDECLFMNYIQEIVEHSDSAEKEVVKSKIILTGLPVMQANEIEKVIYNSNRWWT